MTGSEDQILKITPVILSGGGGARLWPLSRQDYPKQFIPLLDDQCSLEKTLLRVQDRILFAAPVIICGMSHRFLIEDILSRHNIRDAMIIAEPCKRNTAPALAAAALVASDRQENIEGSLLILPADHHIPDPLAFVDSVLVAQKHALSDNLLTFGIVPTGPQTGFGYIEKGRACDPAETAYRIASFTEKPDLKTAEHYLATENYFWNAGMFMARTALFLDEIKRYAPDILAHVQHSIEGARHDLGHIMLDEESFARCADISIDYAIMEKTDRAAVVPAAFEWNDLGSWDSLWDISEKDEHENAVIGNVLALDTRHSYLKSEKQVLCAIGLDDIIAVNTPDALLIAPRTQSEKVKNVVEALKERGYGEAQHGVRTYRPWGFYDVIEDTDTYKVKRIRVSPGRRLSLQYHHHRSEHWVVVSGVAHVTKDDDIFALNANESVYIPCGSKHRLENKQNTPLDIIEIQTGSYFGEDDIIRVEDDYKRE